MSELTFRVRAHSENPTKTVIKARGFELIVDEPEELGGTNAGLNPVEYVLAAFSGCLNVMSHVVAKEMNFELRGVKINLSGVLDPAKFSGAVTTERAGYKQIDVEIDPDTDADTATLEKWLQTIEERCPVSENLTNPPPLHITFKK
jgi:uncharacterized OsmC-like protein